MPWFYLMFAISLDVIGTVFLKLSHGLERLVPTVLMFLFYAASMVPLSLACKSLPISLVYAMWSALGTVLVFLIGMIWFREPASLMKIGSLVLIVVGLIALNLSTVRAQ
ncbi:MAG TPA: SMR family transporter [Terriglobales bacterium]|nr:SMR family transporter [Terriglobales bacterium]